jgi:hypothetical protein
MSIQPKPVRIDDRHNGMRTGIGLENTSMKQYLLNIYQPDGEVPPPEILDRVMRDMNALIEDTRAAGVLVLSGHLHPPSSATVVQFRRGEALITDGPFAEGKEHIGGFLIIRVPDLDAALDWARRMAQTLTVDGHGTVHPGLPIEVRPFHGELER